MKLLDTNICIYALKRNPSVVSERLLEHQPSQLALPSIVLGELLLGAKKSSKKDMVVIVERFLRPFRVVPFDEAAARRYAAVRAELEVAGTPIGPSDLIIAATALHVGATLVTHNTREFARVRGLELEDWA